MEEKNIQIVREYFDQVINKKHLERMYDYCSERCVIRTPPYVGLGISPDDSSGTQLVVIDVAKNGPSAGKVQIGDVILGAADAQHTWEGFDQLRTRMWGMGVLGSEVNLTLLRAGKTIQVTVKRGRVDGFDSILNEVFDRWKFYLQEEIPDVHTEINQIFAAGDWVAFFATSTGTHKLYNQSAVWTECSMVRLENGKIVDWWGLEDTITQWGQFGYHFQSPVTAVQPAAP